MGVIYALLTHCQGHSYITHVLDTCYYVVRTFIWYNNPEAIFTVIMMLHVNVMYNL